MSKAKPLSKANISSNWKKLLPQVAPKSSSTKKRKNEEFEISPNYKCFNKKQKIQKLKSNFEATKSKTTTTTSTSTVTTTTTEQVIPNKDELWFAEDVDEETLKQVYTPKETAKERQQRKKQILHTMNTVSGEAAKLGKYVAIDCEMVGVGPDGVDSALARVSIVNYNGAVVLDCYVQPVEPVTDYRTAVSGIEPHHLLASNGALTFKEVQFKVEEIIRNRILVGHAVYNDLQVLMLSHPTLLIRDTSRYKPFRKLAKGRTPGLKMLVKELLGLTIQQGSHSSVEDARFTMQLYKHVKPEWEKSFGARSGLIIKKFLAKEEKIAEKKKLKEEEKASRKNKKKSVSFNDEDDSHSDSDVSEEEEEESDDNSDSSDEE
ncbi:ribonuclease H-like domain-containing protein [Mycotypha africana]|uniref:ribonuclease H-like domain-containing protein n=1 Tax=Mycotypha africana TaxID=64632 RepID=UPI00230150D0|nr:ribonuclease H-like domain-containing protein [Mycotypha africana]KAI8979363.1 ribonuclease H-like domain-containing protein [Mycotypha africana]